MHTLVANLCEKGHLKPYPAHDCSDCNRMRSRCFQAHNKEKVAEYKHIYHEENRERDNARMREYGKVNRPRLSAKVREWVENNRERANASWNAANHRRRAKLAGNGGSHTIAEWQEILSGQRGLCADCGNESKLTKDHIIPISKGGTDFYYNLQGLCAPCNSRKGAKLLNG